MAEVLPGGMVTVDFGEVLGKVGAAVPDTDGAARIVIVYAKLSGWKLVPTSPRAGARHLRGRPADTTFPSTLADQLR